MDGTGPWYQRVSGGFSFTPSGTRFPCTIRVSFWRNSYVLGASTIPPPSSSLTENTIEVIVTQGALVTPDGSVITPADGAVAVSSVPIVSASGDAAGSDPRSFDGTVSFQPQCNNVETIFTIRATIRWNTKKRQHVLYGIVRECYEDGTPCATACSGSPPPGLIYLTIKNVSLTGGVTLAGFAGTYVLDRVPNFCDSFGFVMDSECTVSGASLDAVYATSTSINGTAPYGVSRYATQSGQTICSRVNFSWYDSTAVPICGSGAIKSGSSGSVSVSNVSFSATGTFDWEISA